MNKNKSSWTAFLFSPNSDGSIDKETFNLSILDK